MPPTSAQYESAGVRLPRVHVTPGVKTRGADGLVELPCAVGVLGDLSGRLAEPLAPWRDREFVEINPESFSTSPNALHPCRSLTTNNKLARYDTSAFPVRVNPAFESLENFERRPVTDRALAGKHLLNPGLIVPWNLCTRTSNLTNFLFPCAFWPDRRPRRVNEVKRRKSGLIRGRPFRLIEVSR